MNKYYELLGKIISGGKTQQNKKGGNIFLMNQVLSMDLRDLNDIFMQHPIAKSKLRQELDLYLRGEVYTSKYNEVGVTWWDYCAPTLVNSYPTYYKELPHLISKINNEKRPSKNYVFHIGQNNDTMTNQLPCLSLMQFQIYEGELYVTVYQRSADSNLGLPSDIYQCYIIAGMIDVPLTNITFFIGNAHIYDNNIDKTKDLLNGGTVKFDLNV